MAEDHEKAPPKDAKCPPNHKNVSYVLPTSPSPTTTMNWNVRLTPGLCGLTGQSREKEPAREQARARRWFIGHDFPIWDWLVCIRLLPENLDNQQCDNWGRGSMW